MPHFFFYVAKADAYASADKDNTRCTGFLPTERFLSVLDRGTLSALYRPVSGVLAVRPGEDGDAVLLTIAG